MANVHHGIEFAGRIPPGTGGGDFLLFVGRSTPEKDLATAIRIAIRCGMKIKVAARIDPNEVDYHRRAVEPLLAHPLVEWLGEIGQARKLELLAGARALLMPINWDEPFGLSFVEALAMGTPVITRPRGALPELMIHGTHGFLAESEDDLADACLRIGEIDRVACHHWAVRRFSTARMADQYEAVYRAVVSAGARSVTATDPMELPALDGR
jgi:glycosyltransferase involved in cell wall biosynthesis